MAFLTAHNLELCLLNYSRGLWHPRNSDFLRIIVVIPSRALDFIC